jgi:hypothetical protein
MTDQERLANLQSLGYTERESQFLLRAALHSGYFLRRQYCAAINRKLGKTIDNFINKLRADRHIKDMDLRYRRKVYSLCSKPLFDALGEPENRNRREHDAQTVKARLMGLDYVLSRQDVRWFPTEHEKVLLFEELGIERQHLPVWRYRSKDRQQTTLRWFVDKPLIFRAEADPIMRFCFVDPGYRTTDAFASFLRNYRPLFTRLERFEVVYIAGFPGAFPEANRLFHRLVAPSGAAPEDPISAGVITYFRDKREHAVAGLGSFDQSRLDRYREARKRFASAQFDRMFDRWVSGEESEVRAVLSPESRADLHLRGTFSTQHLAFNFGLFGSLYESERGD